MGLNQLEIDITLFEKQQELLDATYKYRDILYGGARGGGKSGGIRRVHLIRRIQYPGSKGAIFRKTYPEIFRNHISKLLSEFPALREYWNDGKRTLTLPTPGRRSTLEFCYAERLAEVDSKHQGGDWDDLSIDEIGDWDEDMAIRLSLCNRRSGADVEQEPCMFSSANPGGRGHKWLKRKYVAKNDYKPHEDPERYHFIKSLVDDNPVLAGTDYENELMSETSETLRRAFRYGDWDIEAGQFFDKIRRNIHWVKAFAIPSHWPRFGGYDWGYGHPAAWGWYAVNEAGRVYKYREFVKAGLEVAEQADEILKYPESRKITFWAGHDCFSKTHSKLRGEEPSIAEEFSNEHKITLKRANNARILGAARLRSFVNWREFEAESPDGTAVSKIVGPNFLIMDTCPITFDRLSAMVHDPDNVEDVLKIDAAEGNPYTGDDAYDETRYAIMSRPSNAPKLEDPWKKTYKKNYSHATRGRARSGWTV